MIHSKLLEIQRPNKNGAEPSIAPKSWKVVKIEGESDIEVRQSVIGFCPGTSGLLLNTGFGICSDQGEPMYKSKDLILDFTP